MDKKIRNKKCLKVAKFISKYLMAFFGICLVISLFTELLHPLFWLVQILGAFGIYVVTDTIERMERVLK